MASACWGTSHRLDEVLFSAGYEFEFFQAVRLLAQLHRERRGDGSVFARDQQFVKFKVRNSLAFPASSIDNIEEAIDTVPAMTVSFIGLTGPKGVLPAAYTELAVAQHYTGEDSLAAFLDIFNHRLVELFYLAWEKHHFVVPYERALGTQYVDAFTSYLFDLVGMGTDGLLGRLAVPDRALLQYAGLLAQRPHSAEALRSILESYFGLPVTIEQFQVRWHELEDFEMCSLGSTDETAQLGLGAVAGDAVLSRQTTIRVVFGPLRISSFRTLLPDGTTFEKAISLIRFVLGNSLEFEIQPLLRGDEVPYCGLGDDSMTGSRLGWSAWLASDPFSRPADDAVFSERELAVVEAHQ